jgi:hypothetical protein
MFTCHESSSTVAKHHALRCHPASTCAAFHAIEVSAIPTASGALALSYRLHGDPGEIRIPEPVPPSATDDLWQHTCLEAFVAAFNGPEYREFNFAPSGQWASYRFVAYRERDFGFAPPVAPQFAFRRRADGFQLDALLAPELLPASAILNISLTAVIEASDGSKSYWALSHCAAQPDFHLRQSFSLTLQRSTP